MSRQSSFYTTVKAFSWVTLTAMLAAMIYAIAISIYYWSGIGV